MIESPKAIILESVFMLIKKNKCSEKYVTFEENALLLNLPEFLLNQAFESAQRTALKHPKPGILPDVRRDEV